MKIFLTIIITISVVMIYEGRTIAEVIFSPSDKNKATNTIKAIGTVTLLVSLSLLLFKYL